MSIINKHERDDETCDTDNDHKSKEESMWKKAKEKNGTPKQNEIKKDEDRRAHQACVNSTLDNCRRLLKLDRFNKGKFRNIVDLQKKFQNLNAKEKVLDGTKIKDATLILHVQTHPWMTHDQNFEKTWKSCLHVTNFLTIAKRKTLQTHEC